MKCYEEKCIMRHFTKPREADWTIEGTKVNCVIHTLQHYSRCNFLSKKLNRCKIVDTLITCSEMQLKGRKKWLIMELFCTEKIFSHALRWVGCRMTVTVMKLLTEKYEHIEWFKRWWFLKKLWWKSPSLKQCWLYYK